MREMVLVLLAVFAMILSAMSRHPALIVAFTGFFFGLLIVSSETQISFTKILRYCALMFLICWPAFGLAIAQEELFRGNKKIESLSVWEAVKFTAKTMVYGPYIKGELEEKKR